MKKKQKIVVDFVDDEIIIQRLVKPMRKITDIEVLIEEQSYQPIDKVKFFKEMDELVIKESLEELLAMI